MPGAYPAAHTAGVAAHTPSNLCAATATVCAVVEGRR